jgi:hypothetical protein
MNNLVLICKQGCIRAVEKGEIERRESEPPSALWLSASRDTDCARPAKRRRRRRGEVRGPACAPERWWACWKEVIWRGSRGAGRAHGADVVVIATISSSGAGRGGETATM